MNNVRCRLCGELLVGYVLIKNTTGTTRNIFLHRVDSPCAHNLMRVIENGRVLVAQTILDENGIPEQSPNQLSASTPIPPISHS